MFFVRTKGSYVKLIIAFAIGGGIAAVIGLINTHTGWFSGIFVFDRIEFYGILALFIPIGFFILELYYQQNFSRCWKKWLLNGVIFIASVAILTCGKRTVMLGFIVGFIFVFLRLLNRRNILVYSLLILSIFAASFFSISSQVTRTFELKRAITTISATGFHNSAVKQKVPFGSGLAPGIERRFQQSWLARFPIKGLDYSVTARLARWLVSTDMFKKHPMIGIGFYGVQYVDGFLPDNTYFQVLLESGLVGLFLFFMIIGAGFYSSRKCIRFGARDKTFIKTYGIVWQGMTITFLVMGLGANVFYVFNLIGIYWIFTALLEGLSKNELILETKEAK